MASLVCSFLFLFPGNPAAICLFVTLILYPVSLSKEVASGE